MKRHYSIVWILCLASCFYSADAQSVQTLSQKPYFIHNHGQWSNDVYAVTRKGNITTWVTNQGLMIDVKGASFSTGKMVKNPTKYYTFDNPNVPEMVTPHHAYRLRFVDATMHSPVEAKQLSTKMNFYKGSSQTSWVNNVSTSSEFLIKDIYPHIDLRMTVENGEPRYDLIVAPDAKVQSIKMTVDGAESFANATHGISVKTSVGTVNHGKMKAFQIENGRQVDVACAVRQDGKNIIFDVPSYDRSKPLIIDPTIFATFIGGVGNDEVTSMVVDKSTKDVIVCGVTESVDFPLTTGTYTSPNIGASDVFVARFDSKLEKARFISVLGGSNADRAMEVVLTYSTTSPAIVVGGYTRSTNFPIVGGAYIPVARGGEDGFLFQLNGAGTMLTYSTYFGGSADDRINGIDVDTDNSVLIGGETTTTNNTSQFPVRNGAFRSTVWGGGEGFISRLRNGSNLEASSYWGGRGQDRVTDVSLALSTNGEAYATGETRSSDLQTNASALSRRLNGNDLETISDAFVVRMNSGMTGYQRATYVGGSGNDVCYTIKSAPTGPSILCGTTTSTNLPTTTNALQGTKSGGIDGFIAEYAFDVRSVSYLSYLGGNGEDQIRDIESDGTYYYTVGSTSSSNFPVTSTATKTNYQSPTDGWYARIKAGVIDYCSLFGVAGDDALNCISIDSVYSSYIGGVTGSQESLSALDSAYQKTIAGSIDGVLMKVAYGSFEITNPSPSVAPCAGTALNITWVVNEYAPDNSYSVEYSPDNGASWQLLNANVKGRNLIWNIPANFSGTTQGKIRVRHLLTGHLVTMDSMFSLRASPKILSQPQDTIVCVDQPVQISLNITGTDLRYQWRKAGAAIAGATNPTFQVASARLSDDGKYDCEISGGCTGSSIRTSQFNMTVSPAIMVTSEPTAQTVKKGNTATFTIAAQGFGATYTWLRNNGPYLNTVNAPTLTIPNVQESDAARYRVIVTGLCGADTSAEARLTVDTTVTSVQEEFVAQGTLLQSLSPMPAADVLTLTFAQGINQQQTLRLTLTNAMGQSVQRMDVNGQTNYQINVSELPNGVYYLSITNTSGQLEVRSFILLR